MNKEELLQREGVVAVGIGKKYSKGIIKRIKNLIKNDDCIVVFVEKKLPKEELGDDLIPETIDGVRTDVEEIGQIRTLDVYKEKHRPIPVGTSMCNAYSTACTAGIAVYKGGKQYSLVNEHCTRRLFEDKTIIGDPVIQPSLMDGGRLENDLCGKVAEAYDRKPGKDNIMDSALNLMIDPLIHKTPHTDYIPEIDSVSAGDDVWKCGRTTGHTKGTVRAVGVNVRVNGGDGDYLMVDQIMTSYMADPGDSSSAVFKGKKVVGQLHAGNDQVAIFTPIKRILDHFGVSLTNDPQKAYAALGKTWYAKPIGEIETTVRLNLRTEPRVHRSTLIETLPIGTKLRVVRYIGRVGEWEWCEVQRS
jgi:hypothetical protein